MSENKTSSSPTSSQRTGGVMVTDFNDVQMAEPPSPGTEAQISQAVIIKCSKLDDGKSLVCSGYGSPISRSPAHAGFFNKHKSMLPKPEISPKPTHLKPNLMTGSLHISPSRNQDSLAQMSGSLHTQSRAASAELLSDSRIRTVVPDVTDGSYPLTTSGSYNAGLEGLEGPSTKVLTEKTKGTASILKSTLKRITRLSIRAASSSPSPARKPEHSNDHSYRRSMSPFRSIKNKSPEDPSLKHKSSSLRKSGGGDYNSASLKKGSSASQNSLNRIHGKRTSSAGAATKAASVSKPTGTSNETFKMPEVRSLSRSSSACSTANMSNQTHRSHSLKRASRNKDSVTNSLQRSGSGSGINQVKRSNSMHQNHYPNRRFRDRDLNVKLSRGCQTQLTKDVINEDEDNVVTDLQFNLYMPDLLGGDTGNDVETHVTEPMEPVDVRKNRQLTLDNMKLHREIEKLKTAANESDHLKRELRSVRSRLEEEQRARARIEHELDQHNEKVKLIAKSMDSVEQEFEIRDANIKHLETQLSNSRSRIATLEDKLKVANEVISSQNADLADAVAAQKAAVKEYEVAEAEANELHEFLQAEKFTLAEALKEAEVEVASLTTKVESSEEQCGHLVRLGEQRHQEILALETQLKAMEDKAKEMLLAQGAEISRSTILIAELSCKIEDAFKSHYPREFEAIAPTTALVKENGIQDDMEVNDSESEPGADSLEPMPDDYDESLLNLSNAIKNRVSVEKRLQQSHSSSTGPSLVDRITQIDRLVGYLVSAQKSPNGQVTAANENDEDTQNGTKDGETENGIKDPTDQKENISLNGNSVGDSKIAVKYEEEIAEMKAKYLKHRQIWMTNRDQAESEVMRLDDIYHDTVDDVLKVLAAIPDVVKSNQELSSLQSKLQTALIDEEISPKSINGTKLKIMTKSLTSTEQSL